MCKTFAIFCQHNPNTGFKSINNCRSGRHEIWKVFAMTPKKTFINARTLTYHHLHLRHVFTLCLGVASIFLSQTVYPEAGSCATWHPENTGETRDAAVPVEFWYNCIKLKGISIVFQNSKLDRYCKITSMHGKQNVRVKFYTTSPFQDGNKRPNGTSHKHKKREINMSHQFKVPFTVILWCI